MSTPQDFEEALKELEGIVRRLEEGRTTLSEAMSVYERGMFLKKFCEEQLSQARLKVEQVVLEKDTPPSRAPFELQ